MGMPSGVRGFGPSADVCWRRNNAHRAPGKFAVQGYAKGTDVKKRPKTPELRILATCENGAFRNGSFTTGKTFTENNYLPCLTFNR